ncbi:kelch repeat-containing protein [Actinoplanes sp. NPDC051411]|uniref:Kelch repeat-containing protein n=1 Tax=Actinoplanes sp. NPDC051411 TaxID=3155522 RepID=UPI0034240C23
MTTTTAGPATGSWARTPDLFAAARWDGQHDGAVTVEDAGTVLVAGGADASGKAVKQSAYYDPADAKWHAAGALDTARRLHTITPIGNGAALVTGGLGVDGTPLDTVELYDPKNHSWTRLTPTMGQARWGHSAVLLPGGTVLVAGGSAIRTGSTVHALRSAEIFHPDDHDTWTAAADLTDARTGHTAIVLHGGVVLVCGGSAPVGTAEDPALAFCELYDGTKWTPTGSLRHARRHHQATRLTDKTVLITGGLAPGAPAGGPFDPFSQRTAERFNLDTGAWTAASDMPSGRALHRAVALGDATVLVVGGAAGDRDEAGYRSAVLYDPGTTPGTDSWTPVAGLGEGRYAFAAARSAGNVLVASGVSRSGLAAADPDVTELTGTAELFTPGSHP